ncbi:MAG: ornithine cyclodeaminase family protein [Desulfosarcina sp.]
MKQQKVLYLSRRDVEDIDLPMAEIIEALEQMFVEKGSGKTQMPPKPSIYPAPLGFMHAMPACIPSLQFAGVKWVAGYQDNPSKGLPYISGLLILNDAHTGLPVCVMDCTWVTAKRTGAATAVAAKYLARPDASRLGIIACGVQGRSNLEALMCLFPIQSVHAYDIDPGRAQAYAREIQARYGIEVQIVSSPEQAVRGRDLVVTSGPIAKNPQPVIEPGWLAPGAFASLVDFDSYWTGAALREADKLVTDDLTQMAFYRREGYFQDTPEAYADLGEIVSGCKAGRESETERTIAMNLGLALDDIATGVRIYQRAVALGVGIDLPL